ncbi:MAG: terminase small subunit [Gemmatimonadaceae bacterium]
MATARKATAGKETARTIEARKAMAKGKRTTVQKPAEPGTALAVLTPAERHDAFAREYAYTLNPRIAYQHVYGSWIDDETARVSGSMLLRKPTVVRRINELKTELAERLNIERDRPVRALMAVMELDTRDLFDANDHILPVSQMPEHVRKSIASVKVKRYTNPRQPWDDHEIVEVKFNDRVRAAEAMARILGLTGDTNTPANTTTVIERQTIVLFGKAITF